MNHVFTRILLATDGAEDARLAARAAADLAARGNAELHLVHVWDIASYTIYPYTAVSSDYLKILEDDARAILADEGRRIVKAGGTVAQQHLRQGRPAVEIIDLSHQIGADLIVIGSRGHGALGRMVLGSVGEEIARSATCPILVVRGKTTSWPPKRLIAGNDGSAEADCAARLAAAMASLLGASMLLVRVIPRLPVSAENGQTVGDEMMSRLNESLARQADLLRAEYDTQFESLATVGSPAKVLVDLADTDPETVLLVVGNRGLGRIAQFRLGSVSHDVLHAAHSPVLIVPSREAYPNGRVLQQTFCHSTVLA